jgi:hypothetical protein
VQTFYDTGMRVWIGDEANGIRTETTIDRTANFAAPRKEPEGVTAASWLHEVALRLYPDTNMPRRTEVDPRARAPRRKVKSTTPVPEAAHPPTWIEPQLTRLAVA